MWTDPNAPDPALFKPERVQNTHGKLRAILDGAELWQKGDTPDGYNVAADHAVERVIALYRENGVAMINEPTEGDMPWGRKETPRERRQREAREAAEKRKDDASVRIMAKGLFKALVTGKQSLSDPCSVSDAAYKRIARHAFCAAEAFYGVVAERKEAGEEVDDAV